MSLNIEKIQKCMYRLKKDNTILYWANDFISAWTKIKSTFQDIGTPNYTNMFHGMTVWRHWIEHVHRLFFKYIYCLMPDHLKENCCLWFITKTLFLATIISQHIVLEILLYYIQGMDVAFCCVINERPHESGESLIVKYKMETSLEYIQHWNNIKTAWYFFNVKVLYKGN